MLSGRGKSKLPFPLPFRSPFPFNPLKINVERVMGIEPTYQAWEARVLPLNYTRLKGMSDKAGWWGVQWGFGRGNGKRAGGFRAAETPAGVSRQGFCESGQGGVGPDHF